MPTHQTIVCAGDLTGSKRDTGSIDRGDLGPQSCLDAKGGERFANYGAA